MAEVIRVLRLSRGGLFWYSQSNCGKRISICNGWLQDTYILDPDKPLRMVFSTDLEAEDANIVTVYPYNGCPKVEIPDSDTPARRTYVLPVLDKLLHTLSGRWEQSRIAVWFEQDWTEEEGVL